MQLRAGVYLDTFAKVNRMGLWSRGPSGLQHRSRCASWSAARHSSEQYQNQATAIAQFELQQVVLAQALVADGVGQAVGRQMHVHLVDVDLRVRHPPDKIDVGDRDVRGRGVEDGSA